MSRNMYAASSKKYAMEKNWMPFVFKVREYQPSPEIIYVLFSSFRGHETHQLFLTWPEIRIKLEKIICTSPTQYILT
jgi:hypothetical protein